MKNKPGMMIYKCRRCGALDKSLHAPDVARGLLDGMYHTNTWNSFQVTMISYHICEDGHMGITDLIGGEHDE